MGTGRNPELGKLGGNELLEDLFGLNLRGLRTLWDMFRRPRKVFAAARDANWTGRYTPSIRLVFSLFAITTFFQFIWAEEGSYFHDVLSQRLEFAQSGLTNAEILDLVNEQLGTFLALLPLVYLILQAAIAFALRIWGSGTSFVVRLRLYFLTIVPNVFIGTFGVMFVIGDPSRWSSSIILLGCAFDFLTALRGGVSGNALPARIWRAAILAICSLSCGIVANEAAYRIAILTLE